ncbi:MAG: SPOR domain-containing protein [Magnetococcus sp. THC-1_WYH]
MNGIRIFLIFVVVFSLEACSLKPVLERLAWFDSEPPPKVGISRGTLAVLPLRGPQDPAMTVHDDTLNYFRHFVPMNHAASWKGQTILDETQLFHETTAQQLRALGVQWLLTGRYQPPPKGFFTLEVIGVGDRFPFWMFGIPWTEGEQGAEVVDLALRRFGEKIGLQGRAVVFPVLGRDGFYLPALQHPAPVTVAVQEEIPLEATWEVEPNAVPEALPKKRDGVAREDLAIPGTISPGIEAQGVDGKNERYVLQVGVFAKIENGLEMVQELRRRGYEPEISEIPGIPGGGSDRSAWRVWIGLYDRYLEAREQAKGFLIKESLPVHVSLQTGRKVLFRYAVQVGSFLVPAKGWDLAATLRKRGYEATVQESRDAADRVWHSVWIGRYWNLSQARGEAKAFRDKEGMAVFVTPVDAYSSIRMLDDAPLPEADGVVSEVAIPQSQAVVPASTVAPQSVRYAVQVGSFSDEKWAQTLVDHLRVKGYEPQIVAQTDGKGRVWRMVWIGRFQGFSKARRLRDNYRSRESQPALVTTIPAM